MTTYEEDMSFYDDDILDGLDGVGYVPTMEMQQKLMGSFANFEEKEQAARPVCHVFGPKSYDGQTMFIIRLALPKREDRLYFLKKYSDFVGLQENLREAAENRGWGEQGAISHLPELPADDKVGITRSLSLLGLNDFLCKQRTALQDYMDQLLVQLPDLYAEPHLSQFFSIVTILDAHRHVLDEAIKEQSADVTLEKLKGYWKLKGSQHVWCIEGSGRATLNGKHRGVEYDLTEKGKGAERIITRPDGWSVDLEKSSHEKMFWYKLGHPDLEWDREGGDKAESLIRKYAAKRAALAKMQQEEQRKEAAREKMSTIGEDESQEGSPKSASARKTMDEAQAAMKVSASSASMGSKGSGKGKGYVAPPAVPPAP